MADIVSPVSTKNSGLYFTVILSVLMAFTSLSTDIYLPAMPVMAKALQGNVEFTITVFLVGFCLAQLVWGPISDHLGRRKPLFIGVTLFIIGSAGCAMATSMPQIIFWRVIQAFGACTGPMLARAMIRDLFSRARAVQMLSTLMIIRALAPIIGPLLGGQIIRFAPWNAIFWLLVVIGILMWFSLWRMPETLQPEKRTDASLSLAFHHYYRLLHNRTFMRYTLCLTFYYVGAYAFITGSPFVYISWFGIDPQHYGWLFALNTLGLMAVRMVNHKLVQRYSLEKLLKAAVLIAALAGIVLAVGSGFNFGGIVLIACGVFVFFSMNGVIAATATAAAMDAAPDVAGSASALMGSLQYGSGIISSGLLALSNNATPWTMCWIIAVFAVASAAMVITARAEKR